MGLVDNPSVLPPGISIEYNLDQPGLIVYDPRLNDMGKGIVSAIAIISTVTSLSAYYAAMEASEVAGEIASTVALTKGLI